MNTRLVYDFGINDYDGEVSKKVNGKQKMEPFYKAWEGMLRRCYSEKNHQIQPTYTGCIMSEEWLRLSNFKKWHDTNYIDGFHLDKDIINKGNKVYSPKNCRYVSQKLNNLLTNSAAKRGIYPIGVNLMKTSAIKKYRAGINYNGKIKHIGCYETVNQAFEAYANAKHKIIIEAAREQTDIALREGLVNHAKALLNKSKRFTADD